MRVIQLITGDAVYGVERYVLNLCKHLAQSGIEVIPVCAAQGDVYNRLADSGLQPRVVKLSGYADFAAFAQLKQLVHSTQASIVHAHLGVDAFHAALLARATGVCAVASVHFDEPAYVSRPWPVRESWRLVQKIKNSQIAHFLPNRQGVAERLAKREAVPWSKMTVVNPGLEAVDQLDRDARRRKRECLQIRPDDVMITTVARLSPEKGIISLIEAASEVVSKMGNAQFVLVGDGPDEQEVKKAIAEKGLGDRVKLLGYRDDVVEILSASDLFVLPSREESFGLSVAEAMMCSLPVIATDVGGLSEVIQDGVTGALVSAGNSTEMAAAICRMIGDAERRTRYGIAGRQRALSQFSAAEMARQVIAVYEKCMPPACKRKLAQQAR